MSVSVRRKIRRFAHTKPGDHFLLENSDSPRKFYRPLFLLLLAIIILAFGYRMHSTNYDYSEAFSVEFDTRELEYFVGFLMACMSGMVSAYLFAMIDSRRKSKINTLLLQYAPEDFYKDFYNNISHYEGIIREDSRTSVILRPHKSRKDILLCDIEYSYKTNKLPRILKFLIRRVRTPEEWRNMPQLSEECLDNELVWHNAEYDFPKNHLTKDGLISDYKVTGLEVGGKSLDKELKEVSRSLKMIAYECDIGSKRQDFTFIKYRITIPIEVESMVHISSEFLTLNSSVTFNYSSVSELVNPMMICVSGIKEDAIEDNSLNAHILQKRIQGWSLPRNGWVISWWKNAGVS